MNLFKTLSVLLLAIAAVQGASTKIKCHTGIISNGEGKMTETTCPKGVTQCSKATTTVSGSQYKFSGHSVVTKTCSLVAPIVAYVDCHDKDVLGIKTTTCHCTGHLCNAASTRGISAILAISCLMVALFKVAA